MQALLPLSSCLLSSHRILMLKFKCRLHFFVGGNDDGSNFVLFCPVVSSSALLIVVICDVKLHSEHSDYCGGNHTKKYQRQIHLGGSVLIVSPRHSWLSLSLCSLFSVFLWASHCRQCSFTLSEMVQRSAHDNEYINLHVKGVCLGGRW